MYFTFKFFVNELHFCQYICEIITFQRPKVIGTGEIPLQEDMNDIEAL